MRKLLHTIKLTTFTTVLGLLLTVVAFQQKARAVDFDDGRVEIHGFGDQNFLLSNKNSYLDSNSQGSWAQNELAVLVSAKVTDQSTVWVQIFSESEKLNLDWAFIDYRLTPALTVRGGQIKLPFGIYNETRDVKYLQLSSLMPYLYSDAGDIVPENYRGAGLTYRDDLLRGSVALDAYLGELIATDTTPGARFSQMFGGRLTYDPPVAGVSLMLSGMTSKAHTDTADGRHNVWLASASYVNHDLDLKAEYGNMTMLGQTSDSYYLQAGYSFFEKLTPFVRYDYITTDKNRKSDPAFYQKGLVAGVGYKVTDYLALKAEDHFISGFALPAAGGEVNPAEGKKNWNLFAASLAFMF